jgi:hypothetical protein
MTGDNIDYELLVERLLNAQRTMNTDIDVLISECDRLRSEVHYNNIEIQQKLDNTRALLQTIDQLRSENDRLRIALATGEQ